MDSGFAQREEEKEEVTDFITRYLHTNNEVGAAL